MRELEATYKVDTPLFLGGADADKLAEIRPPAFKGLLRFWFRAITLPQLGSWQAVWEAEQELFGSIKGQASFLLSLVDVNVEQGQEPLNNYGIAYLGYGVSDRGKKVRPYLKQGGSFAIRLTLKKDVTEQNTTFLLQALKALGLFGGAGARSRKGFGSLSIKSLRICGHEIWQSPLSVNELKQVIRDFLGDIGLNETLIKRPKYTAFSSDAKICIAKTGRKALTLLDDIGKELLRYRSYGRLRGDKHVLPWHEDAEQNFKKDHDVILNYLAGRHIDGHPQRIVFGLPQNYFFQSTNQRASVDAVHLKRRASPLFIHIHELGEENYAAVMTLLPAIFLPEEEKIAVKCPDRRAGLQPSYVTCNVDYRVIEHFFDRPAFNKKVVVWP